MDVNIVVRMILHFFNTPPGMKEEQLFKVFDEAAVRKPASVKFFESKSERSSSGLLEFKEVDDALNALVAVNHASIPNPAGGKFPYIMKLCFSTYKKRD
ncbi:unnamed protein product [Notodromas monacha]|uniref:Heterogeneous nuclear ribonucleoprotein L RRM domain-containing protein n=1 Tax=Notodromas monacha TaxID=399045 RepID=A0A7R9GKF3_9CRUS|nr:unnamed protein product [Notodromas monacha]CAG0923848.1 unnamed protein product [Notodromas monacha]